MTLKISTFIIAILLIALFIPVFGVFMSGLSEEYGTTYTDDQKAIAASFDQTTNITTTLEQTHDKVENISEEGGVLDVVGGFFSSAYSALKVTGSSYNSFEAITEEAIEEANLGVTAPIFKTIIIAIVITLIVVGILIAAAVKRDT